MTRPGARASVPRVEDLLSWMRKRGGAVLAKAISDSGPRAFRRKADADAALAELLASGLIVEVATRPRSFSVVQSGGPETSRDPDEGPDYTADRSDIAPARDLETETVTSSDGLAVSDPVASSPIPVDEVRSIYLERMTEQRSKGLTGTALIYTACRALHGDLRRDRRMRWPEVYAGLCVYCDEAGSDTLVQICHDWVHPGCLEPHLSIVHDEIASLIVAAVADQGI